MIHIFILSIQEDEQRRAHVLRVKAKLTQKGIDCTIVNAYYWKSHDIHARLKAKGMTFKPTLSLSQLACFLSHSHLWSILSNLKPGTLPIVLEDDMDLSDRFDMGELEQAVLSLERPHDAILLWKHPEQANKQATLPVLQSYFSPFYYTWGLAAYMFTPAFAKQLLSIQHIDMPVDEILLHRFYPKSNTYVAIPQHFVNLGLLGNVDYGPYVFQSNIWK